MPAGAAGAGAPTLSTLREIVFDTETTGLDHAKGDRIIEFGGVELLNHIPTGRVLHAYINPGRAVAVEAFAVHGLSDAFLADKHPFHLHADEIHAFLGDAVLIAHNASFDLGFLNAEFGRTGHALLAVERIVDSLHLARRKHPGASNTLDALCARYGIDTSRRTKHGALLDAELLAEVYIELVGGRQPDLGLAVARQIVVPALGGAEGPRSRAPRPEVRRITPDELARHRAFAATLGASPLWAEYLGPDDPPPPAAGQAAGAASPP